MRSLDADAGRALVELARGSVQHGVRAGEALALRLEDVLPALHEPGASFVTLRRGGELRGCTGALEATRPLALDVARNAYRSAFDDPRFPPLTAPELEGLSVHVSVLSPLAPLAAGSEGALLAALRPGIDGLVLREGPCGATFLPAVWKSLPDPADFLRELRRKAGLAPGHWSASLRFERYTVQEFE